MSNVYTEELITTYTEDGILAQGAIVRPASGESHPIALVFIHGATGAFYRPVNIGVARALAARGYTTIAGNNRGHDAAAMLSPKTGEPRLGGYIWERFDESPHDIAAWIDVAEQQGFAGIALLGHSYGGPKATYYQALRQDPRVRGFILASPAVRMARNYDPALIAQAERMVAAGRGLDLLPWGMRTMTGTVSAQTYLNRSQHTVDLFESEQSEPAIARIRCPILAFYGTEEAAIGTAVELETIKRNARSAPRVATRMVPGADHTYTDHCDEVGAFIAEWMNSIA